MSRTYRRKNADQYGRYGYGWYVGDWVVVEEWLSECGNWTRRRMEWVEYPPNSEEWSKGLAKFRSDGGTHKGKEPGPRWFRNVFCERPQRREGKRQLQKFMLDENFEVCLNPKDPLPYWT